MTSLGTSNLGADESSEGRVSRALRLQHSGLLIGAQRGPLTRAAAVGAGQGPGLAFFGSSLAVHSPQQE